jgi:hypothetical protein
MKRNRYQLADLADRILLLATFLAVLLYALTPATEVTRGPLLLTAFIAILWQSRLYSSFSSLGATPLPPTGG